MAAFVVLPAASAAVPAVPGIRLNIFPGSAMPAVLAAGAPFWIGYGFVPEPSDENDAAGWALDEATRFELLVDRERVSVATDLTIEEGRTVSKLTMAAFPDGLQVGWHHFTGRWYEAGALVLTNERSIEFVER